MKQNIWLLVSTGLELMVISLPSEFFLSANVRPFSCSIDINLTIKLCSLLVVFICMNLFKLYVCVIKNQN